jgi:hypothetical protein
MPTSVQPSDIVGAAEIAERLGLALPQTVHDWRRRYVDFPEPLVKLKMGLVWNWKEVAAWSKASGHPRQVSRAP